MTTTDAAVDESLRDYSNRQRLFVRYFTAILIDLVVLNLCVEYWSWVTIDSFTISLLAAILLQILLKLTIAIEHRIAAWFKKKPGTGAKIMRFLSAWLVIFGSKFVILEALDITFGEEVQFGGPFHGLVALIVVVAIMLAAEAGIVWLYRRLA